MSICIIAVTANAVKSLSLAKMWAVDVVEWTDGGTFILDILIIAAQRHGSRSFHYH